eukprot:937989-Rhodomonas_salina.1
MRIIGGCEPNANWLGSCMGKKGDCMKGCTKLAPPAMAPAPGSGDTAAAAANGGAVPAIDTAGGAIGGGLVLVSRRGDVGP